MNIGLSYLTQIRGGDDTGQIVSGDDTQQNARTDTPRSLGGWVALTFNQVVSSIAGGYHKQHNGDDTHAGITADSCVSTAGYREHGRAVNAGDYTSVAFNSAYYTASGSMTWSPTAVQQQTYAYTLVGHLMTLMVFVQGTTAGVASDTLKIAIPGGMRAALAARGAFVASDGGGGDEIGGWLVTADATVVSFKTAPVRNWSVGVGGITGVFATCQFEVR